MVATENLTVIDQFLSEWKERATKFYTDLKVRYRQAIDLKQFEEKAKAEGCEGFRIHNRACQLQYEAQKKFFAGLSGTTTQLLKFHSYNDEVFFERLNKMLDREVESKRKTLIARIQKKAGNIVDAKGLYIGHNGEINGVVIGDKATVKVQTIYAGGYNIQCLHYRVLVK